MTKLANILAIDDDPNNLLVISEILNPMFNVKTCTCGLDCMDILKVFKADIILLDISMPEISGYEVCKLIRSHEEYSDINIIFLSGLNHVEDRLAGYEAGGDDYICKPFDYQELLAKLGVFHKKKLKKRDPNSTAPAVQPDPDLSTEQESSFKSQLKKVSRYTNSVLYIQSEFPYCLVVCNINNDPPLKIRGILKKVEESLKDENLIRVHRSYLINPDKVQSIERKGNQDIELLLVDNNEQTVIIPVGRKYQKYIKNRFSKLFN